MIAKRIKQTNHFLKVRLWEPTTTKSKFSKLWLGGLRILVIASKGFVSNNNSIKASALTFYAILSIVPVFAVAFGIAQGFGFADKLEGQIRKSFSGQEEVMTKIIEFSRISLTNVSGGLVAGISIVFLLWSVIKLLNHIENAFNTIWDIKKSRSFIRKFTDYLSLMLLSPIFILLSGSLTVFINTSLQGLHQGGIIIEWTSSFFLTLMQLAPYLLVWILFTFIYIIIPNKNVKFLPALAGGMIAGTVFAFLQNGYVYFQLAMSRYNAIYGSFAALPLFLIWMQISWLIILFGAEISHAVQNAERLIHAQQSEKLSNRITKLLSLQVFKEIADCFCKNEPAPGINELAEKLRFPVNFIDKAMDKLLSAELVLVVVASSKNNKTRFMPATAIENLKLADIIKKLDQAGVNDLLFEKTTSFVVLEKYLSDFEEKLEKNELNISITKL